MITEGHRFPYYLSRIEFMSQRVKTRANSESIERKPLESHHEFMSCFIL
jgi:hypothetical protein